MLFVGNRGFIIYIALELLYLCVLLITNSLHFRDLIARGCFVEYMSSWMREGAIVD